MIEDLCWGFCLLYVASWYFVIAGSSVPIRVNFLNLIESTNTSYSKVLGVLLGLREALVA